MSIQSWELDASSTGAYKENQVAEAFMAAGFKSVLFNLADKRRVASGESLTVPSVSEITFPTSTALDELQTIPLSKLTISAKTISMAEKGRAIAVTGRTQRRSPIDVLSAHKSKVSEMMSRELESVISTALKTSNIKYVANGVASQNITTNGTAGAAALSNPNIYHLRYMSNYMSDTLRAPKHRKFNSYVGLFRGNAIMSIQNDPEYTEINNGLPNEFSRLSVGKIADISLMSHNDDNVLSNTIGTNSDVSEGIIMGDEAVLFGFLEQIRLVYDFSETKATDFGRFKYIAWKGDYGAGLYSDSANAGLARVMHYTST